MEIVKGGEYLTRNGTRVSVHDVNGGGSFTVKGSVWKMYRGKYVPRTFNVWLPNGKLLTTSDSPLDIVSVYQS